MKEYKIATVVVTYNRKDLLMKCLNAIEKQTFKPHTVYIVDNASTDGTKELLEQDGRYYNNSVNGIEFLYVGLKENTGGAGGFYTGMKTAYEDKENFDAVWVMDDDGLPDKNCLANQVPYLENFDFIGPLVLAKEDKSKLAFEYKGSHEKDLLISQGNIVKGYANPMNAILFSKRLIKTVGYPIPELFIWGDEINYWLRSMNAGFTPVTIISAIHVHPIDRMQYAISFRGKRITIAPSYWREYCMIRNRVFNLKNRGKTHGIGLIKGILFYYLWYYVLIKKDMKAAICCIDAFFSGFKNLPDKGFQKWMKK